MTGAGSSESSENMMRHMVTILTELNNLLPKSFVKLYVTASSTSVQDVSTEVKGKQ